jgi:PAS domain S-box-containing protein
MEGKTIYANHATLKIYGYDRIEELKRTPIKERYTPESYAEFKTRKEKRERGEVGPSEYEISIVRKKAKSAIFRFSARNSGGTAQDSFRSSTMTSPNAGRWKKL